MNAGMHHLMQLLLHLFVYCVRCFLACFFKFPLRFPGYYNFPAEALTALRTLALVLALTLARLCKLLVRPYEYKAPGIEGKARHFGESIVPAIYMP